MHEGSPSRYGIDFHGLDPAGTVHWNLSSAHLYELALAGGEGQLSDTGSFAAVTTPHTGRSPKDRFIVREPSVEDSIDWGETNVPLSADHYERLRADVSAHLESHELFVRDARAGEDPHVGVNVRIISTSAWHDLFAHNMFLRPRAADRVEQRPQLTVLHAPGLNADPARHGTRTGTFIVVNFADGEVLIGGTRYAGEIKKSVFSFLNHRLPEQGVLPMHCSANVGDAGDVALFFGLSGTGKTTLSADPERGLIGDDEQGWGPEGVFNFEGGCYAKTIRLSPTGEPEIYHAARRFGAVLENVVVDPHTRHADFDDGSITENTRASYPIHYIENAVTPSRGDHPGSVLFLTADAFGVLPPISRLNPEQAMYHFLSGYTAKVAGTEQGVTEPRAAFSACFGAPFLPRPPAVYAEMLGEKLREHGSRVWLINTGWTGGPHGKGTRIELQYTRRMVRAAIEGELDQAETTPDPNFGVHVPDQVPGVPGELLQPRRTWDDPDAYDEAARKLSAMFEENFRQYSSDVNGDVERAGPAT